MGSGQLCGSPFGRADPFHLRAPSGHRRASPAIQVLLGPHAHAFLRLLLGGQSGAVHPAGLLVSSGAPCLAPASGADWRRLATHLATAHTAPGGGGGVLSPAILFAEPGGI